MKFNFSKEWCEQAAKTEEGIGVATCNPNIFKENKIKYDLSVVSRSFFPDKIDSIKWEDLHYPSNSTNIEREEIDKMVNEEIRGKKIISNIFGNFVAGTFDFILDQVNVDRQVEEIKKSRRPGLLWFLRANRVE